MEPTDDILLPQPKPNPRRFRNRHILRTLAVVLVIVSLGYGEACLRMDLLAPRSQRLSDLLGVAPVFFFGLCLWWYGGRALPELNAPMFPSARAGDTTLGWQRGLWLVLSLAGGFVGLCAVTYGATLAWHGREIKAFFWVPSPMEFWSRVFLLGGALLLVLAGVALSLARKKTSS
jgi:hypothetical protein